jgi:hypothetical protein
MAIIASDNGGGGDFSPVPQGTHIAICNMVVDLGKQRKEWQGQERIRPEIFLRWELPNERIEWDDKDGVHREGPRVIGQTYTLALNERANLRRDLEGWRGRAFTAEELKAFDVAKLLGVPCMITVTHAERNGKTYANVTGVAGIPKGMAKPERTECDPILYDNDNLGSWDHLPEWLQKKIDAQVREETTTTHYGGNSGQRDDLDDDIPF